MDVRKAQDPSRTFGPGPTAALAALRKAFPWNAPPVVEGGSTVTAQIYAFMKANPAAGFAPPAPPMPTH
jgi:hypothetical protein